jgi:hypothetical protein
MRTYGPDDEPDDVKINWIEAGIFQTCKVQVLTRKQFGLCSRLEVDVRVWLESVPVLSQPFHKRYD